MPCSPQQGIQTVHLTPPKGQTLAALNLTLKLQPQELLAFLQGCQAASQVLAIAHEQSLRLLSSQSQQRQLDASSHS